MENAQQWNDDDPRPWSGDHTTSERQQHNTKKTSPSRVKSRTPGPNESSTNSTTTTSAADLASSSSGAGNSSSSSSNQFIIANSSSGHRSPAKQSNDSRKSSRSRSSRQSTREKQRLENLIGREYSLVNEGSGDSAFAVRVTIGSPGKDGRTMDNGGMKTSAKIWIDDAAAGHKEDEYMRKSRGGTANSSAQRNKMSSREVRFEPSGGRAGDRDSSVRETVLFSRDKFAPPRSPGTGVVGGSGGNGGNGSNGSSSGSRGSPIAAGNVVTRKRKDTNMTAKLFKDQVDRLSVDTGKRLKKYGKWKPDTGGSPVKKYQSQPRQRERLTTPLSGSGLMGVELEKAAVEVVLSRHSSPNHQRVRRERLLTHSAAGGEQASERADGSSEEIRRLRAKAAKQTRPPRVPKDKDNNATISRTTTTTTTTTEPATQSMVEKQVVVMSSTMNMTMLGSSSSSSSVRSSSGHPGQATSLNPTRLKEDPPSLRTSSVRGGGVPAMGEHYKSGKHNLAMLKRTMGSTEMPLSKPISLSPGSDPRAYQKKNKKKKKKEKPNYNEHAAINDILRPKGWTAPMFMLPAKSSATGNSNREQQVMTPRSKRFVSSLGGPGLLGATERALRRSVPHNQSGSLESGTGSGAAAAGGNTGGNTGGDDDNGSRQSAEDVTAGSGGHVHSNVHSQHHDEESDQFSQFRTVATATKFWLQHMLREHNLRKGLTADVSASQRPKTPAVKNLGQFLSSAIEHIKWSCTAAGWDAPQTKDLERRVYNVVLDELSDQVASHQQSRGTLFSIIATHYHEVLGQTMPSVMAAKEDLMESLREELETCTLENKHLRTAAGLEEGDHMTSLDRLAAMEEVRNELSAARQVIRARDAEQAALRRRAEHFRRDLLQSEELGSLQTKEMIMIRQQMKEDQKNARKAIDRAQTVSGELRKDIIQAQSKVVHAENMTKKMMEENFEGRLKDAEEALVVAHADRDKALDKAKNATRSEHVL